MCDIIDDVMSIVVRTDYTYLQPTQSGVRTSDETIKHGKLRRADYL